MSYSINRVLINKIFNKICFCLMYRRTATFEKCYNNNDTRDNKQNYDAKHVQFLRRAAQCLSHLTLNQLRCATVVGTSSRSPIVKFAKPVAVVKRYSDMIFWLGLVTEARLH